MRQSFLTRLVTGEDPSGPDVIPSADATRPNSLRDYLIRRGSRVSEEALRPAALAAGYTNSQVDVALEDAGLGSMDPDAGPVVRKAAQAFLVVWFALLALIALNPRNFGNAHSGEIFFELLVVSVVLIVGFVVALIWIFNPRRFMYLLGALILLGGFTSGQALAVIGGIATLIGARRTNLDAALRGEGSDAAFLSMPLIILALIGAGLYNLLFTQVF